MQIPQVKNDDHKRRAELVLPHVQAKIALNVALEKLGAIWPAARDYGKGKDTAFTLATMEHADRLVALRSIIAEIETIAESLE